uniref:CSON015369 protein n=2 Tax=Culicoides sonorensis TaxID=179676 RepID=A0A336LT23_CULSO
MQVIQVTILVSSFLTSIFASENENTATTMRFTDNYDTVKDMNQHQETLRKIITTTTTVPSSSLIESEPETETDIPNIDDTASISSSSSSSSAVVTSSSPLQVDLYEFIDLIPVDEVTELRVRYYVSDPNVRKAYDFIRNYNYTFVHTQLHKMVEVKKVLKFFERKGVNLSDVGDALYERVGPPPKTSDLVIEQGEPKSGGFYAMVDNILDEIPQDEVVTLFFEKMETSHDFSELLDWIGGNDFKEMLNVLRFNKEVQRTKLDSQDIAQQNKSKITAEWDTGWVGGPEVIVEVHETMTNSPNPTFVNDTSIPTEPKIIVRPEEALIVIFVLILWVGAIALFFNRWGKIRMLEPYQPKFEAKHRSSCPLVDIDQLPSMAQRQSFSKMSMGMSLQMPTFAQCSVLGANTLPYRNYYDGFSPRPYSRPRQNSVFVGPHIVSPPQPPRKTRSAVDIHSLVQSEGIIEDV